MPEQAAGFAKAVENPIVAGIVLYLVWLPAEAVLLSALADFDAHCLSEVDTGNVEVLASDGLSLSRLFCCSIVTTSI